MSQDVIITRKPVVSSNISEIGYDEETMTLEVKFNKGAVYRYEEVPSHVNDRLMTAGSVGTYFAANIKSRYHYYQY